MSNTSLYSSSPLMWELDFPELKSRRKRYVPPTKEEKAEYLAEVDELYRLRKTNKFLDLAQVLCRKGNQPYAPAWAILQTLIRLHKVNEEAGDFSGRAKYAYCFNDSLQFVTTRQHLAKMCRVFARACLSEDQVGRGLRVLQKLKMIHRVKGAGKGAGSVIYLRLHTGRIKHLMDRPEAAKSPDNTAKIAPEAGGGETGTYARSIYNTSGGPALPSSGTFGPLADQSTPPSSTLLYGKPPAAANPTAPGQSSGPANAGTPGER